MVLIHQLNYKSNNTFLNANNDNLANMEILDLETKKSKTIYPRIIMVKKTI